MSAAEGSLAFVRESVNGNPAGLAAGALKVASGATFAIVTVTVSVAVRPPSSVTRTAMVRVAGPSTAAAENVAV